MSNNTNNTDKQSTPNEPQPDDQHQESTHAPNPEPEPAPLGRSSPNKINPKIKNL